ncbi:MAG: hypothetical protein QHH18_04520 [Candidatus Bathyarchaeota archaeon]|jgi:hypothetical protein|nr:hypothetical protein [Candidatus Bathyarchaeota archaeon A05DMB-5]MDH7557852.1 hypothetical protein [Candidatus Bathyarchaeota archaeon]
MKNENYAIILLLIAVLSIQIAISIVNNFLPIGWDTYFHIKYSSTIMETAKIPTMNPYFPEFVHGYTPGAHALVAVISIIGGIEQLQMLQLFSFLPTIFAIPIVLAFYSLALEYVEPKYASLASFLYYFSSLLHSTILATNGAELMNSFAYPYVAALVSFVLFPLFIRSIIDYSEHQSICNLSVSSVLLATITLSYHFMAVVSYGVLLTYLGVSFVKRSGVRLRRPILLVMLFGILISSPYVLHIIFAGLPVETGAIKTYATLSIQDYINLLHLPLFGALMFSLLLLVASHKVRSDVSTIPTGRFMILASWMIFLIVMSNAYLFGIFLINDRFAWYLIAPASIIAVLCLPSLEKHIGNLDRISRRKILYVVQCFLIIGTIFSVGLLPEVRIQDDSRSFLIQELDGILWLRENAEGFVIATSPKVGFLLSSLTNVRVVAIQTMIADYYIKNLEQRINDLKAIFSSPFNTSLQIVEDYDIKFIYMSTEAEAWFRSYNLNPYQLLSKHYFEPVFPLKPFIKEVADTCDFDGDGVPETFQVFLWNGTDRNSKLYFLTNPNSATNLTLRGLFHKKGTYGPIRIYVNGVLIKEIVANKEQQGKWLTYQIEVPKEVLKEINKVFVENMDPYNNFYLDYIGFGSTDAMQPNRGILIFEVQYSSSLNIGSEILDIDNDEKLDIFDNFTKNGGYKEYFLYSSFGNETKLTINNLFLETSTTNQVQVYVNNILVGNLSLVEETLKMKWLTQNVTIPEGVLKKGWNTIKFVNVDKNNNWYLNFIQLS